MSLRSRLSANYRKWELVRHQNRQMRDYGFACYNWWRREDPATFWFYRFLRRPRLAPLSTRYRFAFCSVFGDRRTAETCPGDLRIFFTGENLERHPDYADHLLPSVDLALGFDELAVPNYLRLPLWLVMCFPPAAELADIESQLERWRVVAQRASGRPQEVASLVARHDDSGIRSAMAAAFTDHGTVRYGGAFGGGGLPNIGPGWEAKHQFLLRYPFNLCPENSDRRGYVTEKLFHAIAAGCIPLYWGARGYPEPDILNPDALVSFDPQEPDSFSASISRLVGSRTELDAFARQDRFVSGAAAAIYGYYQRLEDRLLKLMEGARPRVRG